MIPGATTERAKILKAVGTIPQTDNPNHNISPFCMCNTRVLYLVALLS